MRHAFAVVILAAGMAASGPLAAWAQPASPAPAFHARRLGDKASPPARIEVVSWLAGHWVGEGLGGYAEESWSEPRAGTMMGMFRHLKGERPVFYEFLLFQEEKGSVVLKLKHFNPDLTGWEEKDKFVDFELVAVEENAVHFDGLTFQREGDDALRIYLLIRTRETGQVREEEFRMRRVARR